MVVKTKGGTTTKKASPRDEHNHLTRKADMGPSKGWLVDTKAAATNDNINNNDGDVRTVVRVWLCR